MAFFAELYGATDTLLRGASDHRDGGVASRIEGGARSTGYKRLFGTGEMHGFAIRAHRYQTDEAGAGKTDRVVSDCWKVEVFGIRAEEGHCRGIDAGAERSERLGGRGRRGAIGFVDAAGADCHICGNLGC